MPWWCLRLWPPPGYCPAPLLPTVAPLAERPPVHSEPAVAALSKDMEGLAVRPVLGRMRAPSGAGEQEILRRASQSSTGSAGASAAGPPAAKASSDFSDDFDFFSSGPSGSSEILPNRLGGSNATNETDLDDLFAIR